MDLLKEYLPWIIVCLFLSFKYFLDYNEKCETIFKKHREKKREQKKKEIEFILKDFLTTTKKHDCNSMRVEMLLIYNTYKDKKEIPAEVFASYCAIFDEYVECGGNHYIKSVIDSAIRSWKIVD